MLLEHEVLSVIVMLEVSDAVEPIEVIDNEWGDEESQPEWGLHIERCIYLTEEEHDQHQQEHY